MRKIEDVFEFELAEFDTLFSKLRDAGFDWDNPRGLNVIRHQNIYPPNYVRSLPIGSGSIGYIEVDRNKRLLHVLSSEDNPLQKFLQENYKELYGTVPAG